MTTNGKHLETELTEYSEKPKQTTWPYQDNLEVDALVVGGGFAGVFMLKKLRDRGFKTVIYEAGPGLGGTWRWNCYPGAGVDSEVPEYEFSFPEVWETWDWGDNYPKYNNLRDYFDHVDKVLGISKDTSFNTVVTQAKFDTNEGKWTVKTADGRTCKAQFLVLGVGFAARRYIPDWPGIEKFKGEIHHSSFWPDRHIDVSNKRCGVIGTGASGVQIVQAWGPTAKELTVFQRTPNLAIPMNRKSFKDKPRDKTFYEELFRLRETTFAGFHYDWLEKNTFDDPPEVREQVYEKAWNDGGFRFWISIYKDNLMNAEANKESYKFWAKKVRARIDDPKKKDILAPLEQPHYFGVKRPCLENNYFEQYNRPNVNVVDIKKNPIKEFDETGILLEDGTHVDLDVVALATGFDVSTGCMTQLGLESINGTFLKEEWATGANTYLGISVSGYPNMFHIYGVHGPTLLSNGPSCVEVQGRFIADVMEKMRKDKIKYINPTDEAQKAFKEEVTTVANMTLFPTTKSTYMGGNVPGKPFELVCYPAGIPTYRVKLRTALDTWGGFDVVAQA